MKKIYLVERTDSCGYDENDACVIIAKKPKIAKEIALKEMWGFENDKIICKLIGIANEKQPYGVVLDSFNAG